MFKGGLEKSKQLPPLYEAVAKMGGAEFLNAGSDVSTDGVDGLHLTSESEKKRRPPVVSMGTNGAKGANATCSWTPWGWRWPVGSKPPMCRTDTWGRGCLPALQSGFPWIRMVMADAGYESRKLARELKRRHGWRLHITKRRQRAFNVVGLTWIVERTFAWLSQKSSLEQRLPS